MTFEQILENYKEKFSNNGSFTLQKNQKMSKKLCRKEGVPENRGVYLIYSVKDGNRKRLLRIGKAGTLDGDGNFKNQKLVGRLNAREGGKSRPVFFKEKIENLGLDGLFFRWFVTYEEEGDVGVVPAKAEADLLQAYFEERKELPELNDKF